MANSPIFYCKNCGRPVKNPAEGCPCIEQGIGFRPPEEKKDEKKRRKRQKRKLFCFHSFAWEGVNRNQCVQKCVKCGVVKPGSAVKHDFALQGCIPVCRRCGYRDWADHEYEPVKGQCLKRCVRCGHEEKLSHQMAGRSADGRCEQYCTVCGFTVPGHMWRKRGRFSEKTGYENPDECKCSVCGELNPAGKHDWRCVTEEEYGNILVCAICGKRDESRKRPVEEIRREYDEARLRMDSLGEMRANGWKV